LVADAVSTIEPRSVHFYSVLETGWVQVSERFEARISLRDDVEVGAEGFIVAIFRTEIGVVCMQGLESEIYVR
jgi:hypothetical protein